MSPDRPPRFHLSLIVACRLGCLLVNAGMGRGHILSHRLARSRRQLDCHDLDLVWWSSTRAGGDHPLE